MLYKIQNARLFSLLFLLCSSIISADSFQYNTYNNHGVVGLVNMPTARLYDAGSFGFTFYDGTPDQKMTMTASPFDWMEASFFYTNIQGKPYPGYEYQDYKDKGFNVKFRVKEEGVFPAIAVGFNDFAGTGFYSSEYIVASYGVGKIDTHFGLGWGVLNDSNFSFKNPFTFINDSFASRTNVTKGRGGQIQLERYFSNEKVSPFFGISYALSKNTLLKAEHDTTKVSDRLSYDLPEYRYSFGLEHTFKNKFTIGLSAQRGNFYSLKFIYRSDDTPSKKSNYKYKKTKNDETLDQYENFIKNLESNGVGVNKIVEKGNSIGVEFSQFTHPSLDIIEEIIMQAKKDSGVEKDIKADFRIANLKAYSDIEDDYLRNAKLIYEREDVRSFNSSTKLRIRPFLAGREGFFRYAILLENDNELVIANNFFFSSNLKYSIKDNFDDLIIPPVDVYPAQVRSDVKDYLRNFDQGVIIGRAQFDYHLSPSNNNHFMLTGGLLEEMFSGYGIEYLYYDAGKNYAFGLEAFNVKKRDYELRFGTLNYTNVTGSANFYYRNYGSIPFDAKVSYGEYLAGDTGFTFDVSRSFENGAKFGVFATFTDVTFDQFGEGSFDKGIYFKIPIYKNLVDYSWRPLTKDPGAGLNRKNTLHDLLVRFKPIN